MSLVDALLLEPAPFEVWIAIRPDGQKGSGRIDDPYDGSTTHDPSVAIDLIARDGPDLKNATVDTSANHGYEDDDYIRITGATGADAAYYNGAFRIFAASGSTFKYRMKAKPAANATGTLSCAKILKYRFDDVMRSLATSTNVTVRIGSGVFETKGFMPVDEDRWQPQAGWKIIGSGIGATTIRLMQASSEAHHTTAIGADYNISLESFEASDFTVDCNLPNQSITEGKHFAAVACGAIGVTGRDVRIRRIRAINFGTQNKVIECFVIYAGIAHPAVADPVNCLIEDCIIEQPSENNVYTITCLHFGGGEAEVASGLLRATYHNSCAIRNCYVNGAFRSGIVSTFLTIQSLTALDDPPALRWRIKTYLPHNYTAGEHYVVMVNSVSKFLGGDPNNPQNYIPSPDFNGPFYIDDIPSSTEIDYTLSSTPAHDPVVGNAAVIGSILQALSSDNGIAAVVEGNRIFNCNTAGPYHDAYSSRDLTVRSNYFHNVYYGVAQALGGLGVFKNGSTLTRNGMTATFTALPAHSFYDGQAVQIAGAQVPDNGGFTLVNPYNGLFEIKVTGNTTFTYLMKPGPDPSPGTAASGTFQFRPLWQIARLVVENNIIDLAKVPSVPSVGAVAFLVSGGSNPPTGPYIFPKVLYRNNIIGHASAVDPYAYGLATSSCGAIIVEQNIVALARVDSLVHSVTGLARYFENLNADGVRIRGYNQTTLAYVDEMRDHIDDVMLMKLVTNGL